MTISLIWMIVRVVKIKMRKQLQWLKNRLQVFECIFNQLCDFEKHINKQPYLNGICPICLDLYVLSSKKPRQIKIKILKSCFNSIVFCLGFSSSIECLRFLSEGPKVYENNIT